MILLPLILAADTPSASPQIESRAYGACVVQKVAKWATGPDEAQVIVKTAEESCENELKEVRRAALDFTEERRAEEPSKRKLELAQQLVDLTVNRVRTLAFTAVLNARSTKTP
ncbi:hypothetical protein [Novosphingobium sp.]|uniref:hypothetical protein n=1 Tax=Novosphingobium sp. TaxID=1874826 RepID=UPI003D6D279F